jgi:hypothetical protein
MGTTGESKTARRAMLFERGEPAVTSFIEPDEQASPFRKRAQIKVAVVIDIGGDNRNEAAGQFQHLRRRTRNLYDDVRLGRTREHHGVEHTIAVEVRPD